MESWQPRCAKILTLPLIEAEPGQHPLEESGDFSLWYHESFLSHGRDGRETFPEEIRVCLPVGDDRQLSGRQRHHVPPGAVARNGGLDGVQRLGFDVHPSAVVG